MTANITIDLRDNRGHSAGTVEIVLEMPENTTREMALEQIHDALEEAGTITQFGTA